MGGVLAATRMGFRVLQKTVRAVRAAAVRKMAGEGETPAAKCWYSVDTMFMIRGRAALPMKNPTSIPRGIPTPLSQRACRFIRVRTCFRLMPMVR